ncbi:MAG: hypothetical protein KF754_12285 [Planctomycetes bacterium]|nr:hypothetical protein [Planctomycetota bacterium]
MNQETEIGLGTIPRSRDAHSDSVRRQRAAVIALVLAGGAIQATCFVSAVWLIGANLLWGNGRDGEVLLAMVLSGIVVALLAMAGARCVTVRQVPRPMADLAVLWSIQVAGLGMLIAFAGTFALARGASLLEAFSLAFMAAAFGTVFMSIPATLGGGVALALVQAGRHGMLRCKRRCSR